MNSFFKTDNIHIQGVHTLTPRENRERQVRNILKSSKKSQYLINTLYLLLYFYFFCISHYLMPKFGNKSGKSARKLTTFSMTAFLSMSAISDAHLAEFNICSTIKQ